MSAPSKIERAEGGVPEWALKRVQELSAPLSNDPDFEINERFPTVIAFARYIAEHEEEPVDPVREAFFDAATNVWPRSSHHFRNDLADKLPSELRAIGFGLAREESA